MMKICGSRLLLSAPTVIVGVAVLLSGFIQSCALDQALVNMWGGDIKSPVLISVRVESATAIRALFSAPVQLGNSVLSCPETGEELVVEGLRTASSAAVPADSIAGESGYFSLDLTVRPRMDAGKKYVFNGTVLDEHGNSLAFAVPLTGYNDRLPRIVINEIRTDYSKPKVEFVEFFTLSAGNLAGMRLLNAANTVDPVYEFPAVEVAEGEYIVLHFRSIEEGLLDELGSDLALSAGTEALPGARDLWAPYDRAPLKKTNVLQLEERSGGAVLDAFLGCESDKPAWPTEVIAASAAAAFEAEAWQPDAEVGSAVIMTGTTTTRTIGRDQLSADTDSAADWKIAPTSGASPGRVNIAH